MQQYRLEVEGMCKSFPGVKALDHVSLRVKPGSVHALIGENGAGKSTLMKCLFGLYHPEEGTIKIDGKPVTIRDTKDALEQGLSMIHQELNPVPNRNVMDNIWVGRFPKKGPVVDEKEMERRTTALLHDLEFDIPCKTMARDLSVSQLQAIEIAKSISYDAKIIIMDEPTSSLTGAETEHLFKLIRKLKAEGRSVIYISHKLEELFEIADEITVMRDGQYVGCYGVDEISIDQLIALMVGRDMNERFPPNEHVVKDENVLTVEHFTSANPRSFKDVSFQLRRGEILGVGGLVGAQRTELVESIFGLRPIKEGKLTMMGKPIHNKNARQAIANGFALLTEERRATGIVPMLSVKDNALVAAYKKFVHKGILNVKKLTKPVEDVCKALDVRMASMETQIKNLSGGNQQKVLVGRWLLAGCNILILDEPTRGVDVGAKYEIYRIMRQLVREGNSIIMVSSEMPELLGMSDRVMVMCEGRLSGILEGEQANQVEVMRLATSFAAKEAVGG